MAAGNMATFEILPRRRTKMVTLTMRGLLLFLLFGGASVIFWVTLSYCYATSNSENICLTRDCIVHAGRVLSLLNTSVNPCQDFAAFSCGRYKPHGFDMDGYMLTNVLQEYSSVTDYQKNEIINRWLEKESPSFEQQVVLSYIKECTNQNYTENLVVLGEYFGEKLSSLENSHMMYLSKELLRGWAKSEYYYFLFIRTPFFTVSRSIDIDRKFRANITINAPFAAEPLADPVYYIDELNRTITDLNKINHTRSLLSDDSSVSAVIDFLMSLANLTEDKEPESYTTIGNLCLKLRALKMLNQCETLFSKLLPYDNISLNTTVKVYGNVYRALDFIANYSEQRDMDESNCDHITCRWFLPNYQAAFLLFDTITHSPRDLRSTDITLSLEEQERLCTAEALGRSEFDTIIAKEYNTRYTNKKSFGVMEAIYDDVKSAAIHLVSVSEVINNSERQLLIDQLNNVTISFFFEDEELEKYVSTAYNTVEEKLKAPDLNVHMMMDLVREEVARNINYTNSDAAELTENYLRKKVESNAYYQPASRKLHLFSPFINTHLTNFYSLEMPQEYLYAAFGYVLAHELAHSMDYDRLRRIFKKSSNSTSAEESLHITSECYMQLYNRFGWTFNDSLNDDFADFHGLMTSLEAFREHVLSSETYALPGLDQYTPEQLFFITYGQMGFCAKSPEEVYQLPTAHSPPEVRVNAVLANMQDFRDAFNCQEGDMMFNKDTCDIIM